MAWRIHDNVVRGEVDNRERGIVRGRIWLNGEAQPIILELKGNACNDLAGCLLTFENPNATVALRNDGHLAPLQRGAVGDLTASRKVRVLDMPVGEAYLRKKKGLSVPEHLANSLYLEWFSEANGRVVIESADYRLSISPPAWRLSPEEEQQRQKSAAEGFAGFMGKLTEAIESHRHKPADEEKEWDEFDYEKLLRESDARADKYGELLDKYKDHPDRDRLVAKEMGWKWLEEALEEKERLGKAAEAFAKEEEEDEDEDPFGVEGPDDFAEPEPDPATEGVDWVRAEDGEISHPLVERVFEKSVALWQQCEKSGLIKAEDDDLMALVEEYQILSAKLAGALDGLAYGRDMTSGAFVVATLKRALAHLHAAQAALEKVAPKKLLGVETISSTRAELFTVREEMLRLMNEFRSKGDGPVE